MGHNHAPLKLIRWSRTVLVLGLSLILAVQQTLAAIPQAKAWKVKSVIANEVKQSQALGLPRPAEGGPRNDMLSQFARIQEVNTKPNQPTVYLLQDIHLNEEAQRNMSSVLSALAESQVHIGVEGTVGPIDYKKYKALPRQDLVRQIANEFVTDGRFGAVSHFALTNDLDSRLRGNDVEMFGLEDAALYKANIDAYRDAMEIKDKVVEKLKNQKTTLLAQANAELRAPVLNFLKKKEAYSSGEISFGSYLSDLVEAHKLYDIPLSLQTFLEAFTLEQNLNMGRVNRERDQLLEKLSKKLSDVELTVLMRRSMDYKAGAINIATYYANVKTLIEQKGLSLKNYPSFDNYMRYVFLSDGVKIDDLMTELKEVEQLAFKKLKPTAREKKILDRSRKLVLSEKLIDFALTPEEWKEYRKIVPSFPRTLVPSFEDFYRIAEKRNVAFINNFLKTRASKVPGHRGNGLLVVGGFHTPDLKKLLHERGYGTVVLTPHITKLPSNSNTNYLRVFLKEKSPLQKLFAGRKLFLGLVLGAGVNPTLQPEVPEKRNLFNFITRFRELLGQKPTLRKATLWAIPLSLALAVVLFNTNPENLWHTLGVIFSFSLIGAVISFTNLNPAYIDLDQMRDKSLVPPKIPGFYIPRPVYQTLFSPDNQYVALHIRSHLEGGYGYKILKKGDSFEHAWIPTSFSPTLSFFHPTLPVLYIIDVALTRDGKKEATFTAFDLNKKKALLDNSAAPFLDGALSASFSVHNSQLAVGFQAGGFYLFDVDKEGKVSLIFDGAPYTHVGEPVTLLQHFYNSNIDYLLVKRQINENMALYEIEDMDPFDSLNIHSATSGLGVSRTLISPYRDAAGHQTRHMAFLLEDGSLQVFDMGLESTAQLQDSTNKPRLFTFSRDNTLIATLGDERLKLFRPTGEQIGEAFVQGQRPLDIAFSPDGVLAASTEKDYKIWRFPVIGGQGKLFDLSLPLLLVLNSSSVIEFLFSLLFGGFILMTVSGTPFRRGEGEVEIDMDKLQEKGKFMPVSIQRGEGFTGRAAVSFDAKWLAIEKILGGNNYGITIEDNKGIVRNGGVTGSRRLSSLTFSPNSRDLVATSQDGSLRTFSVNKENKNNFYELRADKIGEVIAFMYGTRYLVVGDRSGDIHIYQRSGESSYQFIKRKNVTGNKEKILGLFFTDSMLLVVTASDVLSVSVKQPSNPILDTTYDLSQFELNPQLKIVSTAMSPNRKYLSLGTNEGFIILIDLESEESRQVLAGGHDVYHMAFSADNNLLASSTKLESEKGPPLVVDLWEVVSLKDAGQIGLKGTITSSLFFDSKANLYVGYQQNSGSENFPKIEYKLDQYPLPTKPVSTQHHSFLLFLTALFPLGFPAVSEFITTLITAVGFAMVGMVINLGSRSFGEGDDDKPEEDLSHWDGVNTVYNLYDHPDGKQHIAFMDEQTGKEVSLPVRDDTKQYVLEDVNGFTWRFERWAMEAEKGNLRYRFTWQGLDWKIRKFVNDELGEPEPKEDILELLNLSFDEKTHAPSIEHVFKGTKDDSGFWTWDFNGVEPKITHGTNVPTIQALLKDGVTTIAIDQDALKRDDIDPNWVVVTMEGESKRIRLDKSYVKSLVDTMSLTDNPYEASTNIMLEGHKGTGKDTAVYVLGAFQEQPVRTVSFHKDTTQADIATRIEISVGGEFGTSQESLSDLALGAVLGDYLVLDEYTKMRRMEELVALNEALDGRRRIRGHSFPSTTRFFLLSNPPSRLYRGYPLVDKSPSTASRIAGVVEYTYPQIIRDENGEVVENEWVDRLWPQFFSDSEDGPLKDDYLEITTSLSFIAEEIYSLVEAGGETNAIPPMDGRQISRILKRIKKYPEMRHFVRDLIHLDYSIANMPPQERISFKERLDQIINAEFGPPDDENARYKKRFLNSDDFSIEWPKIQDREVVFGNESIGEISLEQGTLDLLEDPSFLRTDYNAWLLYMMAMDIELGFDNALLGPSGTGKTVNSAYFFDDLLQRETVEADVMTSRTSGGAFTGEVRLKNARTVVPKTPIQIAMEKGMRLRVDEAGEAPDALASANNAMEYKFLVMASGKVVRAKPGFGITFTGNLPDLSNSTAQPWSAELFSRVVVYPMEPLSLEDTKQLIRADLENMRRKTEAQKKTWGYLTPTILSVAISKDGEKVAAGTDDGFIWAWERETGNEEHVSSLNSEPIASISFSDDNKKISIGPPSKRVHYPSTLRKNYAAWKLDEKTIRVVDSESDNKTKLHLPRVSPALSLAFTPDLKFLISTHEDKRIYKWNLETRKQERIFQGFSRRAYATTVAEDGDTVALGSDDNTVRLFSLESGKEIKRFDTKDAVHYIALTFQELIRAHGNNQAGQTPIDYRHIQILLQQLGKTPEKALDIENLFRSIIAPISGGKDKDVGQQWAMWPLVYLRLKAHMKNLHQRNVSNGHADAMVKMFTHIASKSSWATNPLPRTTLDLTGDDVTPFNHPKNNPLPTNRHLSLVFQALVDKGATLLGEADIGQAIAQAVAETLGLSATDDNYMDSIKIIKEAVEISRLPHFVKKEYRPLAIAALERAIEEDLKEIEDQYENTKLDDDLIAAFRNLAPAFVDLTGAGFFKTLPGGANLITVLVNINNDLENASGVQLTSRFIKKEGFSYLLDFLDTRHEADITPFREDPLVQEFIEKIHAIAEGLRKKREEQMWKDFDDRISKFAFRGTPVETALRTLFANFKDLKERIDIVDLPREEKIEFLFKRVREEITSGESFEYHQILMSSVDMHLATDEALVRDRLVKLVGLSGLKEAIAAMQAQHLSPDIAAVEMVLNAMDEAWEGTPELEIAAGPSGPRNDKGDAAFTQAVQFLTSLLPSIPGEAETTTTAPPTTNQTMVVALAHYVVMLQILLHSNPSKALIDFLLRAFNLLLHPFNTTVRLTETVIKKRINTEASENPSEKTPLDYLLKNGQEITVINTEGNTYSEKLDIQDFQTSPDGKTLVFQNKIIASGDEVYRLFLKSHESGKIYALSDDHDQPMFYGFRERSSTIWFSYPGGADVLFRKEVASIMQEGKRGGIDKIPVDWDLVHPNSLPIKVADDLYIIESGSSADRSLHVVDKLKNPQRNDFLLGDVKPDPPIRYLPKYQALLIPRPFGKIQFVFLTDKMEVSTRHTLMVDSEKITNFTVSDDEKTLIYSKEKDGKNTLYLANFEDDNHLTEPTPIHSHEDPSLGFGPEDNAVLFLHMSPGEPLSLVQLNPTKTTTETPASALVYLLEDGDEIAATSMAGTPLTVTLDIEEFQLSPDGNTLVFQNKENILYRLYMEDRRSGEVYHLSDPENSPLAFGFREDGKAIWILYPNGLLIRKEIEAIIQNGRADIKTIIEVDWDLVRPGTIPIKVADDLYIIERAHSADRSLAVVDKLKDPQRNDPLRTSLIHETRPIRYLPKRKGLIFTNKTHGKLTFKALKPDMAGGNAHILLHQEATNYDVSEDETTFLFIEEGSNVISTAELNPINYLEKIRPVAEVYSPDIYPFFGYNPQTQGIVFSHKEDDAEPSVVELIPQQPAQPSARQDSPQTESEDLIENGAGFTYNYKDSNGAWVLASTNWNVKKVKVSPTGDALLIENIPAGESSSLFFYYVKTKNVYKLPVDTSLLRDFAFDEDGLEVWVLDVNKLHKLWLPTFLNLALNPIEEVDLQGLVYEIREVPVPMHNGFFLQRTAANGIFNITGSIDSKANEISLRDRVPVGHYPQVTLPVRYLPKRKALLVVTTTDADGTGVDKELFLIHLDEDMGVKRAPIHLMDATGIINFAVSKDEETLFIARGEGIFSVPFSLDSNELGEETLIHSKVQSSFDPKILQPDPATGDLIILNETAVTRLSTSPRATTPTPADWEKATSETLFEQGEEYELSLPLDPESLEPRDSWETEKRIFIANSIQVSPNGKYIAIYNQHLEIILLERDNPKRAMLIKEVKGGAIPPSFGFDSSSEDLYIAEQEFLTKVHIEGFLNNVKSITQNHTFPNLKSIPIKLSSGKYLVEDEFNGERVFRLYNVLGPHSPTPPIVLSKTKLGYPIAKNRPIRYLPKREALLVPNGDTGKVHVVKINPDTGTLGEDTELPEEPKTVEVEETIPALEFSPPPLTVDHPMFDGLENPAIIGAPVHLPKQKDTDPDFAFVVVEDDIFVPEDDEGDKGEIRRDSRIFTLKINDDGRFEKVGDFSSSAHGTILNIGVFPDGKRLLILDGEAVLSFEIKIVNEEPKVFGPGVKLFRTGEEHGNNGTAKFEVLTLPKVLPDGSLVLYAGIKDEVDSSLALLRYPLDTNGNPIKTQGASLWNSYYKEEGRFNPWMDIFDIEDYDQSNDTLLFLPLQERNADRSIVKVMSGRRLLFRVLFNNEPRYMHLRLSEDYTQIEKGYVLPQDVEKEQSPSSLTLPLSSPSPIPQEEQPREDVDTHEDSAPFSPMDIERVNKMTFIQEELKKRNASILPGAVAFKQNGVYVAVGINVNNTYRVLVFKISSRELVYNQGYNAPITALAFHWDKNDLIIGTADGKILGVKKVQNNTVNYFRVDDHEESSVTHLAWGRNGFLFAGLKSIGDSNITSAHIYEVSNSLRLGSRGREALWEYLETPIKAVGVDPKAPEFLVETEDGFLLYTDSEVDQRFKESQPEEATISTPQTALLYQFDPNTPNREKKYILQAPGVYFQYKPNEQRLFGLEEETGTLYEWKKEDIINANNKDKASPINATKENAVLDQLKTFYKKLARPKPAPLPTTPEEDQPKEEPVEEPTPLISLDSFGMRGYGTLDESRLNEIQSGSSDFIQKIVKKEGYEKIEHALFDPNHPQVALTVTGKDGEFTKTGILIIDLELEDVTKHIFSKPDNSFPLAFSPNGKSLLIHPGIGVEQHNFKGLVKGGAASDGHIDLGNIIAAAWSVTGLRVVSDGPDVFRLEDGPHPDDKVLIDAHTSKITALSFNRDGTLLAVGEESGKIVVWNVEDPENPTPVADTNVSHEVHEIKFHPSKNKIAIATEGPEPFLFDVDTKEQTTVEEVFFEIVQMEFVLGGAYLAISGQILPPDPMGVFLIETETNRVAFDISVPRRVLGFRFSRNTLKLNVLDTREHEGNFHTIGPLLTRPTIDLAKLTNGLFQLNLQKQNTPNGTWAASSPALNWWTSIGTSNDELYQVNSSGNNNKERVPTAGAQSYDVMALSPDGHLAAGYESQRQSVFLHNLFRDIRRDVPISGKIYNFDFSPDNTTIIASQDGEIRHFQVILNAAGNVGAFVKIGPIKHNLDVENHVKFSPDGTAIAVVTKTGNFYILDAETGEKKVEFDTYPRAVDATDFEPRFSFSPDGRLFAIGFQGHQHISVYTLKDKEGHYVEDAEDESVEIDGSPPEFLAFSPDGMLLIIGTGENDEKRVRFYFAKGDKAGHEIEVPELDHLNLSKEYHLFQVTIWNQSDLRLHFKVGKREAFEKIATVDLQHVMERTQRLEDPVLMLDLGLPQLDRRKVKWLPEENLTLRTRSFPQSFTQLQISGDGKSVLTWDEKGNFVLRDNSTYEDLATDKLEAKYLTLNYDGTQVYGAGEGQVLRWQLDPFPHTITGDYRVFASPTGDKIALVSEEGVVAILDAYSGEEKLRFNALSKSVGTLPAAAFSPDGNFLALARPGFSAVRVFDVSGTKEKHVSTLSGAFGSFLAFSRDGKTIIGLGNGGLKFWEFRKGHRIYPYKEIQTGPNEEKLLPTVGIVTGEKDLTIVGAEQSDSGTNELQLLTLKGVISGKPTPTLDIGPKNFTEEKINRNVKAMALHPHLPWQILLTKGTQSGSTFIGSLNQPKQLINFSDMTGPHVLFSPDGRLAAAQDDENRLHLWDTMEAEEIKGLDEFRGGVTPYHNLIFTFESSLLYASEEELIKRWFVGDNKLDELSSIRHDIKGEYRVYDGGNKIVTFGLDSGLQTFHLSTGRKIGELTPEELNHGISPGYKPVGAVSPDGKYFFFGTNEGGRIWIIDISDASNPAYFDRIQDVHWPTAGMGYISMHISPDNQLLITGGRDGVIQFFSLRPENFGERIKIISAGAVKGHSLMPLQSVSFGETDIILGLAVTEGDGRNIMQTLRVPKITGQEETTPVVNPSIMAFFLLGAGSFQFNLLTAALTTIVITTIVVILRSPRRPKNLLLPTPVLGLSDLRERIYDNPTGLTTIDVTKENQTDVWELVKNNVKHRFILISNDGTTLSPSANAVQLEKSTLVENGRVNFNTVINAALSNTVFHGVKEDLLNEKVSLSLFAAHENWNVTETLSIEGREVNIRSRLRVFLAGHLLTLLGEMDVFRKVSDVFEHLRKSLRAAKIAA